MKKALSALPLVAVNVSRTDSPTDRKWYITFSDLMGDIAPLSINTARLTGNPAVSVSTLVQGSVPFPAGTAAPPPFTGMGLPTSVTQSSCGHPVPNVFLFTDPVSGAVTPITPAWNCDTGSVSCMQAVTSVEGLLYHAVSLTKSTLSGSPCGTALD